MQLQSLNMHEENGEVKMKDKLTVQDWGRLIDQYFFENGSEEKHQLFSVLQKLGYRK